jgi:hypothetical protein
MLHRFLRHENGAEHVGVEVPMEVLLRDLLQRGGFVDAGVVHQNVDPADSTDSTSFGTDTKDSPVGVTLRDGDHQLFPIVLKGHRNGR